MHVIDMTATGQNIKAMIKAKGFKIADVQARCGFNTPQAIFKWLRGDTVPTIDNMIIIADMFGVNGVTTEYIDRGDFDVKFVRAEKDAIGYDGEPLSFPITIELTAKEDVTDLTLLKLDNYEFDTVHGFSYSFTDQLTIPKLERGKTFVPTVDIPETIPAFGIRYRDIHGVTHYYDISISGKDGSVLLTPFFEKG